MEDGKSVNQPVNEGKKSRILLVDDEEVMLETMFDVLSMEEKYDVYCSGDVKDAIRKLQSSRFDLVITDLRMPGMSGPDLYRWILCNQSHLSPRVIFTSGDVYDPVVKEFLSEIPNPSLMKPFDLTEFLSLVETTLPEHLQS